MAGTMEQSLRQALPRHGSRTVRTDEALIVELQRGDQAAFEALFERHRDVVWRFFRRRVADRSRVEELVQDVFVGVLEGARRYQARASFRAYLFGIAYNVLHSDWRRRAHATTEPLDEDRPAPSVDPDAAIWVRGALATLDPEDREIVMLREYEQLSYQELADVMDLRLNTVRSRLFRARQVLRTALARRIEGHP